MIRGLRVGFILVKIDIQKAVTAIIATTALVVPAILRTATKPQIPPLKKVVGCNAQETRITPDYFLNARDLPGVLLFSLVVPAILRTATDPQIPPLKKVVGCNAQETRITPDYFLNAQDLPGLSRPLHA